MENKIYYISGPITHPDPKVMEENKLAFHCAEELLKQQGFKHIVNPARFDDENASYAEMLMACLDHIEGIDVLVMINGWQKSKGARAERALAKAFNKKIIHMDLDKITGRVGSVTI